MLVSRGWPVWRALPRGARSLTGQPAASPSLGAQHSLAVDYDVLAGNYRTLQAHAGPGVKVVPTLKANGYGHGAVRAAQACAAAGADFFAVANLGEALQLREGGTEGDILVMSYIPTRLIRAAAEYRITATVYCPELAQQYQRELSGSGLPRLACHVKVDTGMGRMGALPADLHPLLAALDAPCFDVDGIFTHFSSADADIAYTEQQLQTFWGLVAEAEAAGRSFQFKHTGNSAATLLGPHYTGNMARTAMVTPRLPPKGIALYGGRPSAIRVLEGLRPLVHWSTAVAQVKAGVAILPVGYADGLRRGPPTVGSVLVGGARCDIQGTVAMHQVAVTLPPAVRDTVQTGDPAVLVGEQGEGAELTFPELADSAGTIDYELMAAAAAAQSNRPFRPFTHAFQTRICVDYDGLANNYRRLQGRAGSGAAVVPSLGGNAWGHGLAEAAQAFAKAGATRFAVASLAEALQLRRAGDEQEILVASYTPPRLIHLAATHRIAATVFSAELAGLYREQLEPRGLVLACHLAVDCGGPSRLGTLPASVPALMASVARECFRVEAISTTVRCGGDEGDDAALSSFRDVVRQAEAGQGHPFPLKSIAGPAAALTGPGVPNSAAVRDLDLYGAGGVLGGSVAQPCLEWTTEVAQVKTLPAGHPIGYSNTYTTTAPERIAVLPVGYADGYRRGPHHCGVVLVGGVRCPIRGRVSMEKTVVSLDGVPGDVRPGDPAVLVGRQGAQALGLAELAANARTTAADLLLFAAVRQPREPRSPS